MQLCSAELWEKIVTNKAMTHIGTCNRYYTYPGDLDLSGMTSLNSVYLYNVCTGSLTLPESVTSFSMGNINFSKINFPATTKLTSFSADQGIAGNEEKLFSILSTNLTNVTFSLSADAAKINWNKAANYDWTTSKLNYINLYQWGGSPMLNLNISGLGSLTCLQSLRIYKMGIKDLKEISKLTNLTSLDLNTNLISSIDGIENLTKLTSLTINDNNISDLYNLSNLKALTTVNLQNNCIYDTSSRTLENGENTTYNNLKVLADLNVNSGKGGKLTNLYISGNSSILDYSNVASLKWNAKSGF